MARVAHALFGVLVLLSSGARAGSNEAGPLNKCLHFRDLFFDQLLGLKPEFLKTHHKKYTIELPSSPVDDQCASGNCWVYSTVSKLEGQIQTRTGKTVDLSEHYLALQGLRLKALDALRIPGEGITEGGQLERGLGLVDKFGLIPASAWRPRLPLFNKSGGGRLFTFLNARVAQFQSSVQGQSAAQAAKLGPEALETWKKNYREAARDLDNLIDAYVGTPPHSFEYEGKTYTPRSFAETFVPEETRAVAKFEAVDHGVEIPQPKPPSPPSTETPTEAPTPRLMPPKFKSVKLHVEDIEQKIVAAFKRGFSVQFDYEHASEFVDKKTGIMSIAAFHTPTGYKTPSRQQRDALSLRETYHLVDVIGVELDSAGTPIKYKVKNSWGSDSGDEGYYHMYSDFFRDYIRYVYVNAKGTPKAPPPSAPR